MLPSNTPRTSPMVLKNMFKNLKKIFSRNYKFVIFLNNEYPNLMLKVLNYF